MDNTFELYAIVQSKINDLEKEKEALRKVITDHMIESGETKRETVFGNFSISRRKTWTYPEYVTKLEDEFKAAQEKSKSMNEATCVEKESLTFTSIKI
jgi:glutamate synthase domain-containing protein 3